MANEDYQDDDEKVAGYFDDITSPLTKAGIDPDEALMNRDAALAKVSGQPAEQPTAPMPDYPGGANYPSRPAEDGSGTSTVAPIPSTPISSATPSPAAAPAATTPATPDMQSFVTQGLQGQLRATQGAEATVGKYANMPSEDQALKGLEAERANRARFIAPGVTGPRDKKGDVLPQYKPSFGQRVMRGIGAVARGGVFAALDPTSVGKPAYGAPNKMYDTQVAQQAKDVGSLDQQITQARKNYEDASARLKAIAPMQRDVATGYRDVQTGAVAQENAENKQELQQKQGELDAAKAEAARNAEPKTETEIALAASKAQQSGDAAGVKKYQGALSILKAIKQAGRDTSASDVAKAIQASEFGERATDKINTEKESERNKAYGELDKDINLKYNASKMADARQAIDSKLEAKYGPRIQGVHDQVADMLGLTKSGQKLNAQDAARAPKNQPKSRPQNGSAITVDGKPGTVVGWNDKTNKPIVKLN